MSWPAVVTGWGTTAAERASSFPCEGLIGEPDDVLFRAVDVAAPGAISFRWLCQLRAAPYSYDLLDNRGRRSPQRLTPGLERLEVGQTVMSIFKLVEFEPGRSITLLSKGGLLGLVSCTYRVEPVGERRSRIVVRIEARYPRRGPQPLLMRLLLPVGDLVMMRRQLLNLAELAARSAASS